MISSRWLVCNLAEEVTRLWCVLFCKFLQRSQHDILFCKLVQKSQVIASYLPHFAEVIECWLMVFIECVAWSFWKRCWSFVTQNTSASLYSISMYQIKFPPPHLGYYIFNFLLPLPRLFQPPFFHALKGRLI